MKSANNLKNGPGDEVVARAVECIQEGLIVGIPTETYYGLAVDPESDAALELLFAAKRRPAEKPILILISHIEQLYRYTEEIPDQYTSLIQRYWPGPLTLVFKAKEHVSTRLTARTGSVGIRLTSDPVARKIIEGLGRPITATSANLSTREPCRSAEEVKREFGEAVSFVVDGGHSTEGPGSTVVCMVGNKLCIARKGRIELPGVELCS